MAAENLQRDVAPPSAALAAGAAAPPSPGQAIVETVLIFLVFVVHAGLQVPGVNEPYYLEKAKHFWNPAWCGNDFFLQSGDSHSVFYWLCGWWTLLMPLAAVAIVGRLVTYALLAVAWRRLSAAVVPGAWWALWSAGLMVALASQLNMAGEWIVGGFEAKGLSFAVVLFALEAIARNRWSKAWILLGLATSLHVLIGGWSLIAAALAWLLSFHDQDRPRIRAMLGAMALGAALALPGVLNVVTLDRGADTQTVIRSARIQVFERLGHHLDPGHFLLGDGNLTLMGWRFTALCFFWAMLCRLERGTQGHRRLQRFVLCTLLIAAAGVLIYTVAVVVMGNTAVAALLLRFYWFRLADAMLPLGAAVGVTAWLADIRLRRPRLEAAWLTAVLLLVGVHLGLEAFDQWTTPIPLADRRLAPDAARYADWLEVCRMVEILTPPDAVILTPPGAQTFKWRAQRAEVVVWKEMPQDAVAVLRWRDRVAAVQGGPNSVPLVQLDRGRLLALGQKFHASYLVVAAQPRLNLHCLYQNNSFALYELTSKR